MSFERQSQSFIPPSIIWLISINQYRHTALPSLKHNSMAHSFGHNNVHEYTIKTSKRCFFRELLWSSGRLLGSSIVLSVFSDGATLANSHTATTDTKCFDHANPQVRPTENAKLALRADLRIWSEYMILNTRMEHSFIPQRFAADYIIHSAREHVFSRHVQTVSSGHGSMPLNAASIAMSIGGGPKDLGWRVSPGTWVDQMPPDDQGASDVVTCYDGKRSINHQGMNTRAWTTREICTIFWCKFLCPTCTLHRRLIYVHQCNISFWYTDGWFTATSAEEQKLKIVYYADSARQWSGIWKTSTSE